MSSAASVPLSKRLLCCAKFPLWAEKRSKAWWVEVRGLFLIRRDWSLKGGSYSSAPLPPGWIKTPGLPPLGREGSCSHRLVGCLSSKYNSCYQLQQIQTVTTCPRASRKPFDNQRHFSIVHLHEKSSKNTKNLSKTNNWRHHHSWATQIYLRHQHDFKLKYRLFWLILPLFLLNYSDFCWDLY